jgi:Ser/Thr protein kinase RdoA (MazF antagonist)
MWRSVRGGLSGSDVYCGEDAAGEPVVALKRWPVGTEEAHLLQIHAWMQEVVHLPFIPQMKQTLDGLSLDQHQDRLWDATQWLPGRPCVRASAAEVELACEAAAQLHEVWSRQSQIAQSPGVRRRVEVLQEWPSISSQRIELASESLSECMSRTDAVVNRVAGRLLMQLKPWQSQAVRMHPCIRDLRGDHVLFEHGRVAGVIDFGAMGIDTPTLDLARLLGDLAAGNEELMAAGLKKYRACRTGFDADDDLIALLERVGVICSLVGWRVRFSRRNAQEFTEEMKCRLAQLLARAELISLA